MFKIEKNIPIPARSHGRNSKYSVMLEMEDGDSIVFRTGNEGTYAQNFAKKKGIRTVRRAQSDRIQSPLSLLLMSGRNEWGRIITLRPN